LFYNLISYACILYASQWNAYARCIRSLTRRRCSSVPKADFAKSSLVIVKLTSAFYLKPHESEVAGSRDTCPVLTTAHDRILLTAHWSDLEDDLGFEISPGMNHQGYENAILLITTANSAESPIPLAFL
jgi:hypothetical protein